MPDLSFFRHTGFGLGSLHPLLYLPCKAEAEAESFDCRWSLCVVWAGHYGLLGLTPQCSPMPLGSFRAILCYHNDRPWAKHKGWVVPSLGLYLGAPCSPGMGSTACSPASPCLCTTLALWTHNMARTRLLFLVNSPPMLAS